MARSAQTYTRPSKPPRPEWIYRRPKPPTHTRTNSSSPHFKGRIIDLPKTGVSFSPEPRHNCAADPFSSTIFHSRSRSEQSFSPSLKSIKSQSVTALNRTPSSPSKISISSPKLLSARPPSISSTSSISTSTSRSSSPRTPASSSSSPYTKRRRTLPYRLHPENDSALSPLSSSCLPSKSILTRTSSISTKESSFAGNKSVKFAAVPVVHYATASYWDLENFDKEEATMGININTMDIDDSYHGYQTRVAVPKNSSHLLDITKLRESQCATPTPEREKAKTKGLKRLMSLTRKPLATATTNTSVATVYRSRPVISMPYALGTHPTSAMQSNASLLYSTGSAAGSAPDLVGMLSLRSAPSLESFRSSNTRSVRSVGSLKRSSSTRGLRAWLGRAAGWSRSRHPPEC